MTAPRAARRRATTSRSVQFSGDVRSELPDGVRVQLEADLRKLFPGDAGSGGGGKRPAPDVYVSRVFAGYSPVSREKVVLAVEVSYGANEYERHIVKIGARKDVAPDYDGWQTCTRGRMVSSRIFAPVRKSDLDKGRVAVLYRDAFTLFGPATDAGDQAQPKTLEQAAHDVVFGGDDRPDPRSMERALAHIFTDLGLWFYRNGTESKPEAHTFYGRRLRLGKKGRAGTAGVFEAWDSGARMSLRQRAVWVLAGSDAPDADPRDKPARYLDPVDYVRWAMAAPTRLPSTRVGRSHGDLHARNILVGVRRGEVQYPAVFDYGEMRDRNVLAWDFVKLETELKVRLLPRVVGTAPAADYLLGKSRLRKPLPAGGIPSAADRLAAFLAFEELLDTWTSGVTEKRHAESIAPMDGPPTGVPELDRLLGILLRIRRDAALWLGHEVPKRQTAWRDELYFALGVYGLINVRWDYTPEQQEVAVVAAGAALARLSSVPQALADATKQARERLAPDGRRPADAYPSYRVPLAVLYAMWNDPAQHERGHALGAQLALRVKGTGASRVAAAGEVYVVRPDRAHAIPLVGQALLLATEAGRLRAVEPLLMQLREKAREFNDYETLARLGRYYKESGDRRWEEGDAPGANGAGTQMYDKAFEVYSEAYEATGDWYVGINAATLALLTGKDDLARRYAAAVAETCRDRLTHDRDNRYWLYATLGEAALIVGRPADDFYRDALDFLAPHQRGMAKSSYKQVCRLRRLFRNRGVAADGAESVLKLFETIDPGLYPPGSDLDPAIPNGHPRRQTRPKR